MFDNSREHTHAGRRTFLAGTAAGTSATLVGRPAAAFAGGGTHAEEDWPDGPGRRTARSAGRRAAPHPARDRPASASRPPCASSPPSAPGTPCPPRTTRTRHRRRPRLDLRHHAAVRRGVRRPDDRREAVLRPGAGGDAHPHARPRSPTCSPRCAAADEPDRVYVVSGPLRLPGHRRDELHRRRARRRRRRLRRRGLDGARPGDGDPPAARPPRASPRSPARSRASTAPTTWPSIPGRRRRRAGHVHQRHRRQLRRPTTAPATRTASGSSPRACRPRRPPAQANTRRSVGGENDSPPRQLARFVSEVADNDDDRHDVRVIYRRDRYLRGGDHIPFLERGFPAARFTEPNENFAHQHQDVRVENGVAVRRPAGVLRLRLHRAGGPGQRRHALVAGPGTRARRRTSRCSPPR